jgi:hypothetical protein
MTRGYPIPARRSKRRTQAVGAVAAAQTRFAILGHAGETTVIKMNQVIFCFFQQKPFACFAQFRFWTSRDPANGRDNSTLTRRFV